MNVRQLLALLQTYPPEASVLLEGDAGYSPLGGLSLQANEGGLPDEVILHPDMTPD
ncbi:hypothetical protein [Uliginosibacterium aquaticum]|uniref:Uncharacterized protein n=1 Tax=Uliginosibacterium aquaticum TaxID=2731212 RepID=A0ABX2IE60_9RHOO|nr:hypothetical protein [Uliginosibacterium aquaticum]NSL54846.1 hypothetical protein [Uliginosibacterium aquaticum]